MGFKQKNRLRQYEFLHKKTCHLAKRQRNGLTGSNIMFSTCFSFYVRHAAQHYNKYQILFESSILRDSDKERYPEDPRDKVENSSLTSVSHLCFVLVQLYCH